MVLRYPNYWPRATMAGAGPISEGWWRHPRTDSLTRGHALVATRPLAGHGVVQPGDVAGGDLHVAVRPEIGQRTGDAPQLSPLIRVRDKVKPLSATWTKWKHESRWNGRSTSPRR